MQIYMLQSFAEEDYKAILNKWLKIDNTKSKERKIKTLKLKSFNTLKSFYFHVEGFVIDLFLVGTPQVYAQRAK